MKLNPQNKALLALFASAMLFGSTFLVVKNLLVDLSPMFVVFCRFLIASIFFLIIGGIPNKNSIKPGLVMGFFLWLGYYTQTEGLVTSSTINSGVVTGFYVVLTPLLSKLINRTDLQTKNYVFSFLGFTGILLISSTSIDQMFGNLFTFVCAMSYAIHIVLVEKEVNNFKKDIKISVIRDDNPNAFVFTENRLIISSGLIEQAPDYVSLLAVLAHEVGHLHYFHLEKRENSLEQLSKLNLLTNIATITGGILANDPQILAGSIAGKANINNFYLSFSREQEREADLFSIETLQKLKLPANSVKELLKILEQNALSKGYDEEFQKFSTHPIFRERYQMIDNNALNEKFDYDENTQDEFNFIKAKFLGFNDKSSFGALKNDHKI